MTTDKITPTWQATAIAHLERLAWALISAGLCCRSFYEGAVPQLRVFHSDLTLVGLTVTATERKNGDTTAWLFHLSTGVLTSPCEDVPAAVQDVKNALRPVYAALGQRDRP